MTPKQALAKLKPFLGPHAAYRMNPHASDADERAAALLELPALRANRDALKAARSKRAEELLANDAEYQRLKSEEKLATDRHSVTWGRSQSYRITVGHTSSMFFHVDAQGDTWADVLTKLATKGKL